MEDSTISCTVVDIPIDEVNDALYECGKYMASMVKDGEFHVLTSKILLRKEIAQFFGNHATKKSYIGDSLAKDRLEELKEKGKVGGFVAETSISLTRSLKKSIIKDKCFASSGYVVSDALDINEYTTFKFLFGENIKEAQNVVKAINTGLNAEEITEIAKSAVEVKEKDNAFILFFETAEKAKQDMELILKNCEKDKGVIVVRMDGLEVKHQ